LFAASSAAISKNRHVSSRTNSLTLGMCPSQMEKSKCDPVVYWRLAPVRCEAATRPKAGPKQKCLSHARIDANDPACVKTLAVQARIVPEPNGPEREAGVCAENLIRVGGMSESAILAA
jgi:hypothetical protein